MATTTGASGKTYTTNANGTTTITYANADQAKANGATLNSSGQWTRTVSSNDANFAKAYASDVKSTTSSTPTVSSSSSVRTTSPTTTSSTTVSSPSSTSWTGTNQSGATVSSNFGTGMSDWTNIGNGNYITSNNNHSLGVKQADGTYSIYNPGDSTYQQAWDKALAENPGYTATRTTERSIPTYDISKVLTGEAKEGTRIEDTKQTYTTPDYLFMNPELQYALSNFDVKGNAQYGYVDAAGQYAASLLSRIGTPSASDGHLLSEADVYSELDRLGLSDYRPDKGAMVTSSGAVLPAGYYNTSDEQRYAGSGSNGDIYGTYTNFGGHSYLTGGDAYNQAQYANIKNAEINPNNQLNALDYLYGNMMNNPYVQGDPDVMGYLGNNINAFTNAYGSTSQQQIANNISTNVAPAVLPNGQTTQNLTNASNTVNNIVSGVFSSGAGGDILNQITNLLGKSRDEALQIIAQQRAYYENQSNDRAKAANISKKLNEKEAKERYGAMGLGASGIMQSAQNAINNQYGSDLASIYEELDKTLMSLSEEEYKAMQDYYKQVISYTYSYWNDSNSLAMQQANLNETMRHNQWSENMQQQQFDRDVLESDRKYEMDVQNQQIQSELTAYAQNQDAIDRILSLYQSGSLSGTQTEAMLKQYGVSLSGLASIAGGYKPTTTSSRSTGGSDSGGLDLGGIGNESQNPTQSPTKNYQDLNGDGKITQQEIAKQDDLEGISDKDGDGKVTYWDALLENHPYASSAVHGITSGISGIASSVFTFASALLNQGASVKDVKAELESQGLSEDQIVYVLNTSMGVANNG